MPGTAQSNAIPQRPRHFRPLRMLLAAAAIAAVGTSGLALASSGTPTLRAARNAQLAKGIVVDAKGETVYALKPETAHHVLCRSKACLQFWPPVTTTSKAKLKAGTGVHGRLGVLRRSAHVLQVTLGGLPLYRFALDHGKAGNASGQGIQSFGGTWHVIAATARTTRMTPPATTTSTTSVTTTTTSSHVIPGY